jgi:hypothetical protein
MAWVNLSAAFGYGTILTSTQMQNLRDNLTALANGDSGAPLISEVACDETESPGICKIKVGTYTGDGGSAPGTGDEQTIAGVGFAPKKVAIWRDDRTISEKWFKTSGMGVYAQLMVGGGFGQYVINTLTADGFTVDDNNADADPNKNGASYRYIAWG